MKSVAHGSDPRDRWRLWNCSARVEWNLLKTLGCTWRPSPLGPPSLHRFRRDERLPSIAPFSCPLWRIESSFTLGRVVSTEHRCSQVFRDRGTRNFAPPALPFFWPSNIRVEFSEVSGIFRDFEFFRGIVRFWAFFYIAFWTI